VRVLTEIEEEGYPTTEELLDLIHRDRHAHPQPMSRVAGHAKLDRFDDASAQR